MVNNMESVMARLREARPKPGENCACIPFTLSLFMPDQPAGIYSLTHKDAPDRVLARKRLFWVPWSLGPCLGTLTLPAGSQFAGLEDFPATNPHGDHPN